MHPDCIALEEMMDLEPLDHPSEVTTDDFTLLFRLRLADMFPRALGVFNTLGQQHAFSVSNVLYLGLQKGNVAEVLEALEKWCAVVVNAPDVITAYVDTRQYFDIIYAQYFMTPADSVHGMRFEKAERIGSMHAWNIRPVNKSQLWLPPSVRKRR